MEMMEVWVCYKCHRYGHPTCLQAVLFDEWVFCGRCAPQVEREYRQYLESQQLESCRHSLADQLQLWKGAMVFATGVLGTVGMTIGGAGAVLAGGALALGKRAAMGMSAALPTTTPTPTTTLTTRTTPTTTMTIIITIITTSNAFPNSASTATRTNRPNTEVRRARITKATAK